MQLYCCGTLYQLFNAINIKQSIYPDKEADLLLLDSTDFSRNMEGIKQSKIFSHVFVAKGSWKRDRNFLNSPLHEKKIMSHACDKMLGDSLINNNYDEYFMGAQTPFFKFIYYYICNFGSAPTTFLFEDGLYSYVLNFIEDCNKDGFDHDYYGSKSIKKNLHGIYLYGDSSLYFGSKDILPISIPRISQHDKLIIEKYRQVYGEKDIPRSKFIFLEEGMYQDHLLNSDLSLLEEISSIIGKENIVVKRHPRCTTDRFTSRGYKIWESQGYPLEVAMLNAGMFEKVLLSISSTALITAPLVFDMNVPSIQLLYMIPYGSAGPHVAIKSYKSFLKRLSSYLNKDEKHFFTPNSFIELKEIINYLVRKGRLQ